MGNYRFDDLSQDDLRKLVESLDHTDVPVFCLESDTNRVIYANSAWIKHASRLHDNFVQGSSLEQALLDEFNVIAPQISEDIRKQSAKTFADRVANGGQYEFAGPDGKLYRGHYTHQNSRTLGVSFDVTEIKMRRAETKSAQKTLQATLDGLHHGVLVYDETGHVSFFNESFEQTASSLGIKIEQGMFHLELREQLPENLKVRLTENQREDLGNFEFVQPAPNGRHYLFESRQLANGMILVTTVDVSELQERREENKQIQATLEQTLGGLGQGVMLLDLTGHVVYANASIRSFAEETGAKIEKGMHFSEIQENVPHQGLEATTSPNGDHEYVIKGAYDKVFLVRRRFLKDIGILVSTVEITELEQRREESKQAQETLISTVEGLPHGVMLYDLHGNVQMVNSVFNEMLAPLNIRVEKGMSYIDVSAQMPRKFRDELQGKDPGSPFELVQKSVDGKTYLTEGRPVKNIGFLITIVEITQLQDALEAAKAADIAKTSFLANMSHEIRTPMNGVLGMAQVLEQTAVTEQQQKCINIIRESSELLLRIINDILDISKLEAEKVDIEEIPFDLDEVINSAVAIVKPKLEEKPGLEIILDVESRPEQDYVGDAGRIRQVLINLLGNGVKFTETGHVKLTAKIVEAGPALDQILFEIEDTGIGIEPDKIAQIFERFEQSDMSTTRQYGGTGLGLSISKKLTNLMGGSLEVCDVRTEGACFKFSLTLPRQAKTAKPTRALVRCYENTPVLVIDDNKVNHMVISNHLQALKVKTFCVESADKGLSILRKMVAKNYQIPLVICDYQMPGKTGYEFVKEMRSDPAIADTPVIIVSSADVINRREKFIELDVNHVLEKPCSRLEIIAAVSDELYKFHSRDLDPVKEPEPLDAIETKIQTTSDKRILVADDDPVNREVFGGFLNLLGYDPMIVENGLEALKAFAENNFDLVMMDISMPVLGGLEATQKIRDLEQREDRIQTPIIAVTAHALKGDRERFLASGMNDYLAKPILKSDLATLLDKWFDREKMQNPVAALAS